MRKELGEDYPVDTHFRPAYDPWDQRLCMVPDGDLFASIRRGDASVATDTIETFTRTGVRLSSGEEIEADVVVPATGITVEPLHGVDLVVDDEKVDLGERMAYKAMLLDGVPNFVFVFGYTNASWTLKADLVSAYVVRLLRLMDERGQEVFVVPRDETVEERPFSDFSVRLLRASPAGPAEAGAPPTLEPRPELRQGPPLPRRRPRGRRRDPPLLSPAARARARLPGTTGTAD